MNSIEDGKKRLVFGARPVLEGLEAGKAFLKIYVSLEARHESIRQIKDFCGRNKIWYSQVPVQKLDKLVSGKNHQGVVGFISPIDIHNIQDIQDDLATKENCIVVLLDRITDVRNFGAIARTALAADVNCLVVPVKGSAPANEDAIKTSAGALFNLTLAQTHSVFKTVKFFKDSGFQVIGGTESGETSLFDTRFGEKILVVFGSEEDGISSDVLKLLDSTVKIPLQGQMASLNVSVAAGVFLFEILRQRSVK